MSTGSASSTSTSAARCVRSRERARSGSYLLRDPQRMGAILERVVRACRPTPVTAKIRLGVRAAFDQRVEIAQVVEAAGAAALTVHGRTAQDFFSGSADWQQISRIKPQLKRIPLIGNGDLDTPEKVVAAFRDYAVDGVMIARASLGTSLAVPPDPGRALPASRCLPTPRRRAARLPAATLPALVERFGEAKGTMLMRKYACCYAQGLPGARQFRTQVARARSAGRLH